MLSLISTYPEVPPFSKLSTYICSLIGKDSFNEHRKKLEQTFKDWKRGKVKYNTSLKG